MNEESNLIILQNAAKTSKKVCGIDAIPSWLIEKFIQSDDARIVKYGLSLATEKKIWVMLNYVENS